MGSGKPLSRRGFLEATGALAAGGALGSPAFGKPAPGRAAKRLRGGSRHPNILLMLVDEMRYPTVYEAQGLTDFRDMYLLTQKTLRETGVEFHRHYAASTACAPSRTSIFTGQYPSLHGVTQTTGAAKEANDPDVFWLDPAGVPTMGDWFKAGGYRTYYRGKWHVSNADLQIPGTHDQIKSYDSQGNRDPQKEELYTEADRLSGYGFEGWIGPEPHGKAPLNTGSSPANAMGRDTGFASQCQDLLAQLDADPDDTPFLMVASFVNPHDIALWGYFTRHLGLFDFNVEPVVPDFLQLFDLTKFAASINDDLSTKPQCQQSYQESYSQWMQGVPPSDYFRFYYQLQKNVDEELMKVYQALQATRFFDDTIVVFTSDHGDLLGAHHYMHQKWYQTYEEALHVPLFVANTARFPAGASIDRVTSHVDLVPTLLGMAGLDPADLLPAVTEGHTDAQPLVGRNLERWVREPDATLHAAEAEPIFFMTDDDPSRGLNQDNFYGVAYDSVIQPNHIEAVIVEIEGELWKFSRYFDNLQFWSDVDPSIGPSKDIVFHVQPAPASPPGEYAVKATERVKYVAKPDEFEMYNVTQDPLELVNLARLPAHHAMRVRLEALLDEQRAAKRLRPKSGVVPGQP